ncbi:hypothetical protein F2Q68_00005626 [Brassica cretica]|uniref:Clathrin/coatomer adaptor adaptin-like N-terminal domain-containing protein n=1 Tax=Brassica cretica TaxID=69181 RepID=A0A8S9JLJ2_BRACR|nr:hypothetical protein F2Q68_00005626 [Brassica cretica]
MGNAAHSSPCVGHGQQSALPTQDDGSTCKCAISLMAPVMGSEITCSKFLPVVVEAAKDRVPNIKFNVAKLMQTLIPIVDQSVVDKIIRQCLVDLSEDPDVDVRYFANQALRSIDYAAVAQS